MDKMPSGSEGKQAGIFKLTPAKAGVNGKLAGELRWLSNDSL
jgi:hypothetical protein